MKYIYIALVVEGFGGLNGYFQIKRECSDLKELTKNKLILWGNSNNYKLCELKSSSKGYLCYKKKFSGGPYCIKNDPIYINDKLVSMVNEYCKKIQFCAAPLYLPIDYKSDTNITIQANFCLSRISFPIIRNNSDKSFTLVHFYLELSPAIIDDEYDIKNSCMILNSILIIDTQCLQRKISNIFKPLRAYHIINCLHYSNGSLLPENVFAYKTSPSYELDICMIHKSFKSYF